MVTTAVTLSAASSIFSTLPTATSLTLTLACGTRSSTLPNWALTRYG
jgi:hypothetical protein